MNWLLLTIFMQCMVMRKEMLSADLPGSFDQHIVSHLHQVFESNPGFRRVDLATLNPI